MKIAEFGKLCYNMICSIISEGANNMRKYSRAHKEWLDRHARRYAKKPSKRKPLDIAKKRTTLKNHIVMAPKVLSLTENLDETLLFFNQVLSTIKKCGVHDTIYFNLLEIETLTYDAVMYIIAIIANTRRVRLLKVACSGNVPKSREATEILEKSGFFSFVYSANKWTVKTDNAHMQITNGKHADGALVGNLCNFSSRNGKDNYCSTKRLYPMILELMTNTYQHAYRETGGIMCGNWYIFAEKNGNITKFLFLDTGEGIPHTISKKFIEKLRPNNDPKLISSALRGDTLRSETGQKHRGKGLPQIYDDCKSGRINNMLILSGKGMCAIKETGEITEVLLDEYFLGTLFSWEFIDEPC